jgi:hypothetical protein
VAKLNVDEKGATRKRDSRVHLGLRRSRSQTASLRSLRESRSLSLRARCENPDTHI